MRIMAERLVGNALGKLIHFEEGINMMVKALNGVNDGTLTESLNKGLTPLKNYVVIEKTDGYIRVVNDDLKPVMYPEILFTIVDDIIPLDWIEVNMDGEASMVPRVFSAPFFFEDYFDGVKENLNLYEAYIRSIRWN